MHLRAAFKAGRWDEIMIGVITDTFQVPRLEPVNHAVPQPSAVIQEGEMPQTFVAPRKKAASVAPFLPIHPPQGMEFRMAPGALKP